MKVLITGAAGFLGSNLVDRYLSEGHEVIGVDDLSTGSLVNLDNSMSNKKFTFINHDVRDPIRVASDVILNFACPASPVQYQLDPVRTIETNFLGVANLLKLAKDNSSMFIQSSTSEVYGDPAVSPQTEEYWGNVNPIGIRSCYDEGKRAAETLCFDYRRQHSMDIRVVRIFNTYGPRMSIGDGRVVSNFIVQALRNEDITIYGDGNQTRSFCYVDDLVNGFYMLSQSTSRLETPLNMGNPVEFTMNKLATMVILKTGSKAKLRKFDLPQDDPKQRKPDITKIQEHLGWIPTVDLDTGLDLTIQYFKKIINEE
jgi:UDP-glucuronate decarboxylase